MLQIRCKNNNVTKSFPEGTSLLDVYQEFADEINLPYPVVSAKVNNASQGLKFRLYQNRDVEFLDAREGSGHRVYVRSLCFVLYKATQDLFPGVPAWLLERGCRTYWGRCRLVAGLDAGSCSPLYACLCRRCHVLRRGRGTYPRSFRGSALQSQHHRFRYWLRPYDGS